MLRKAEQFDVPNKQKRSKMGKILEINKKHSSFDGLIQEDIDLSDIYLAVSISLK